MMSMEIRNIPVMDYATTEAVNTLASNLIFSGTQFRTVMMTSCEANEGKSSVTFQLAQRLAGLGYSVMLVDCDFHKSVFVSRYDMVSQGPIQGLTHYLAGRCSYDQIEYQTNIPNLFVVPGGKEVVNSLPLLTSEAFNVVMRDLSSRYHFVLVDAPPVGIIIDAAMIANVCDGTLFVVTNEKISRKVLRSAVAQVQKSGCTVLGVVLNRVRMNTHKSRHYYYKSYYSHYSNYGYSDSSSSEGKESKQRKAARDKKEPPQRKEREVARHPQAKQNDGVH